MLSMIAFFGLVAYNMESVFYSCQGILHRLWKFRATEAEPSASFATGVAVLSLSGICMLTSKGLFVSFGLDVNTNVLLLLCFLFCK